MSTNEKVTALSNRVGVEFNRARGNTGTSRRMHPFHLALASQEDTPANIFMIGDSVFEGAVCDTINDRAQRRLERSLRHKPGGQGYHPAWVLSPFVPNPATFSTTPVHVTSNPSGLGVQYSDNAGDNGLGAKRIGLQKQGWAQWTFTGDRVRVWFSQTNFFGINANVIIDGSVKVNLAGGGADEGSLSWVSDPLTPGTHTIRIQESSNLGGSFWLEGVEFFNGDYGSGVHVYDGARSGSRAEHYADPASKWPESMAKVNPSLVLMMFGFNDHNQRTPEQYGADMLTVAARISETLTKGTYTLGVVAPWSPAPAPSAGWKAYMDMAEQVAELHPHGVLIRIIDRWSVMTAGEGNPGMFATDTIHPNSGGQRLLGTYLASSLSLPVQMR